MLSDEEKKAIELLEDYLICGNKEGVLCRNLRIISTIIEKQSKEIEELKKENKEIRDWKYVIDNPIDLKKLSELDIIKIFGKSYIAKDKIKAKIEEVKDGTYDAKIVLQSLLEKE